MNTQSKAFAVYALFFSLVLSGCGAGQIFTPTVTPTATQTKTPEPTQTSTPELVAYHVEEASEPFTDVQIEINSSESTKDQQARMQRWLDYWIIFENRPFAVDTNKLSWKYIYDNPEDPNEVMVIMEAGGEYGGKLFTVPIANGAFVEEPPKEIGGEEIPVGSGPLELSAGAEGQWLSVENGILVRKDGEGKVVERLNMQTAQWEKVTPEIKQFNICTPEKFHDCPIDVEDLFNGNYFHWLNTLSKPFDSSVVKDVPLERRGRNPPYLLYNTKTEPNFPIKGTEPFRRDVTAAFVSIGGINYAVMPVEYYDKNEPLINKWVITARALNFQKGNKNEELDVINMWRNKLRTTVIVTNKITPSTGKIDPLVSRTFSEHPDMEERFERFANGDFKALSEPGIVVSNIIAYQPNNPNYAR